MKGIAQQLLFSYSRSEEIMVSVSFCLTVADEACVGEENLVSDPETYADSLPDAWDLEGAVIIECGEQPEVRIEDELLPTVQNVCFGCIPDLLAQEHVVVRYFGHYGYLRFDPEGAEELVSGDFVPKIRVPRVPFAQGLYACGGRFLDFLRQVYSDQPNFEADIDHVLELAKAAGEALKKHDALPDSQG